MFKKLSLTFFLLLISLITIYPSKKESTNLIDYCYSLEKIFSRNSIEKNKNLSKKFNTIAKDISFYGTKKSKGALVNKMIDQYKTSKKLFILKNVPNKFYCLAGYWIEELNPGTFKSIIFEKSRQRIDHYKNIKKEFDELMKDINSGYESRKKEIEEIF